MTQRWHVDHCFLRCDVERFVEAYFSEEFNQGVSREVGLKERRLVEHEVLDDGRERRRVRMVPTVQLPKAVQKLIGDREITYDEVSLYDPARKHVDFHIDHGARDRLEVKGTIRFLADPRGVRRVIDGEVHAKVFGLGKIIEKLIESETVKAYDKINRYMQGYLDRTSAS